LFNNDVFTIYAIYSTYINFYKIIKTDTNTMKLVITILLTILSSFVFSQAGDIDTSFGDNGRTITEFEGISIESQAMAVDSEDKIVIVGFGEVESDNVIVAVKYLSDGRLDTDFADEGKFIFRISETRNRCYGVKIDSLNNIYLAGHYRDENFDNKGFVIKLTTNGTIDSTFATNGIWLNEEPDTDEQIREILIQKDGKILITGTSSIFTNQFEFSTIVIRLNADGTIDDSFGQNGIAKLLMLESYVPWFAGLNSNDEIITGGFSFIGNSANPILIKFTENGVIDMSFGTDGIQIDDLPLDETGYEIAFTNDDKILLVSSVTTSLGRDFGLTRYNENGTLDVNFGSNGKISTDFFQGSNVAHSVVIQNDGKIILSGFLGITPNHNYAIARYDSLGFLDSSFGNSGKVSSDFELDDLAIASAIQSDGKLLCAGHSRTDDIVGSFSIARYYTESVSSTSDISDNLNSVTIIPNPSNGQFRLLFNLEYSGNTTIDLLTLDGKLLRQLLRKELLFSGEKIIEIDLDKTINSGLYMIRIQTENSLVNQKIVINK